MADADHQHADQRDEERVLDLEVPEDEARSVEGGFAVVSNIEKTQHDTVKNTISNIR